MNIFTKSIIPCEIKFATNFQPLLKDDTGKEFIVMVPKKA